MPRKYSLAIKYGLGSRSSVMYVDIKVSLRFTRCPVNMCQWSIYCNILLTSQRNCRLTRNVRTIPNVFHPSRSHEIWRKTDHVYYSLTYINFWQWWNWSGVVTNPFCPYQLTDLQELRSYFFTWRNYQKGFFTQYTEITGIASKQFNYHFELFTSASGNNLHAPSYFELEATMVNFPIAERSPLVQRGFFALINDELQISSA